MRDDIGPMSLFLQRCFDSLANGSVYAGLAVALSMVFRSTGVLNLAQGQMATVSAYIAYLFASEPGPQTSFTNWVDDFGTPWPPWAAILVAVIISTFIGAGLERVVIRPLEQTIRYRPSGRPLAFSCCSTPLYENIGSASSVS